MQSDYQRIGFNASPHLQQVVFPLLAFPQFQDSCLSFRSSSTQMAFRGHLEETRPCLGKYRTLQHWREGHLEFVVCK